MRRWDRIAPALVTSLAAVFAFRRLDDFDTWWHLAAGRFIALHKTIPAKDVLSHTVRDHPWINLQWGFDLAIYALDALLGPVSLSIAAAAAFTLTTWLLYRLVRPEIGNTAGAVLVLAAVLVAQDRFNIRPEMASFPLLLVVLAILVRATRAGGRGAWRLLPVMLVWVNLHALFAVGALAIVCAFLGAPSRRLALWGLVSVAAAIVNPFGVHGALFPWKLLSRIDRSDPSFQSIAEFRSPFSPDVFGTSAAVYKVLLIGGAAVALAALVARWVQRDRSGRAPLFLDLGGLAFFASLAALSLLARRNLALFALGASPFLARSLAATGTILPERVRAALRRAERPVGLAVSGAAVILAVLVASGWFYRYDQQTHDFGAGVMEGRFPARAADFVREARLPGRLYNDLASGGYLAWDDPIGDGVFVDGRLEVYDTAFYAAYVAAMYDQARWDADAERYGVQTAIVFHHWENRRQLIQSLLGTARWSLVYADEAAAVLVRTAGNEEAIARAGALQDPWNARTRAWLSRPAARFSFDAGRVEATRAFARLLAILGDGDGSAEVYHRLFGLGITQREEVDIRLSLARYFQQVGRTDAARPELDRVLEIDPGNREARALRDR